MTIYTAPSLDHATPIVDPKTGRITPYFQRFWQNLSFTADTGANSAVDFAAEISQINGDIAALTIVVAAKAPLASPALTGNPTAPTQTAGNNSTRLATTAFVRGEFTATNINTALGYTAANPANHLAKSTFTPWAAWSGTADRTTHATYTAPTISASPTQAEVQAIADALQSASRAIKALIDDVKV